MNKKPEKSGRRKSAVASRHRSPVPPPGGPMGKPGYDRPAARKIERKSVQETLPTKAVRPIEPEEIAEASSGGGEEE